MSLETLNVLVYGSGAREHAIVDAIGDSPYLNKLYLANGGLFSVGENVEFADYDDLCQKAKEKNVELVIIGPEQPICDGLGDIFKSYGINTISVNKKFSKLESSKFFAKEFMNKYNIKNAKVLPANYNEFPQVIKKDGLCKGKGVKVIYNSDEKNDIIQKFKEDYFIEEFLDGEELSIMSLFDGENLLNFCPARDFKRLSADINSPNTGGMASYCPVDLTQIQQQKLDEYLLKLESALKSEKAEFTGFIYSGLIWSRDDWYVLEYNVRLGDPETQSILTHLKTDFLTVLKSAVDKNLSNIKLEYKDNYSACLTIASLGYPEASITGDHILLPEDDNVKIYNAGVCEENGNLYSTGGRVLSLCVNAKDPFSILKEYADKIKMEHKYYRDDVDILNK